MASQKGNPICPGPPGTNTYTRSGPALVSSVLIIAVTSRFKPQTAHNVILSLYSYTMIAIVGFVVSGGLIFLYMGSSRQWNEKIKLRPFKYPFHVITYFVVYGLIIFAAFALPDS